MPSCMQQGTVGASVLSLEASRSVTTKEISQDINTLDLRSSHDQLKKRGKANEGGGGEGSWTIFGKD